jgi:adenylate cyclase
MRRWHGIVIGLLILAVGIAVRVEDPEMLQSLRLSVFAIYQRLHPRPYQPVPVRVVDVDDESLARYGQWPWPRTLVAKLVERLRQAEAAAVVLDVVFAEADRTSPQRIIGTLPDATQRRVLLEALQTLDLPNNDEALAGAIAGGRVVTGFAPADDVSALPHRVASFAFVGADPLTFALDFAGAVVNLPSLESGAAGNGALTVFPDLDGLVHRMPLLVGIADGLYPSLIAEGVRVGQGATTIMVKSSDVRDLQTSGTATGITDVKIGRFIAPTDRQGQFWLYDTGPVAERHIPAWKILGPRFDDKSVTGMIAVVGVTAAGLADTVSTPLNAVTTAAELNAQGMEQVLLGVFLQRPLWATGAEILFLAVLGLALTTAFLPRRFGAVTSTGLGALIIVAGVAVSWWAFTAHGLLLDPVYPVMIGLAIYLANALLKYMVSESQRKEVRAAFGQYVAPALVDELAKNPAALKLGGQSRDMTVLFCDVRDFTAISERLEPESLTRLLNHFLTMMSRQILSRRGTIDKYMGDAIMAFWNAPLPDPDHARHACETALAMIVQRRRTRSVSMRHWDRYRPLPGRQHGVRSTL